MGGRVRAVPVFGSGGSSAKGDFFLSFLSLIFLFYQGKTLKLTKDFCLLPNPLKPWKKQRKSTNNQGNSLLKINQGIPKNQGREGQGFFVFQYSLTGRDGSGFGSWKTVPAVPVPLSQRALRDILMPRGKN